MPHCTPQINTYVINKLSAYPERCFSLLNIDWTITSTLRYINSRSNLPGWEFHPVDIQKQCGYGDYVWRRVSRKLVALGVMVRKKLATGTVLVYQGLEKIWGMISGSFESVGCKPTRWLPTSLYNVYIKKGSRGSREEDLPFDSLPSSPSTRSFFVKKDKNAPTPPRHQDESREFREKLGQIAEVGAIHPATIPVIEQSVTTEIANLRPGYSPERARAGVLRMVRERTYRLQLKSDEVKLDEAYYEVNRLAQNGLIPATDVERYCVCFLLTVWLGRHSMTQRHAFNAVLKQVVARSYYMPTKLYQKHGGVLYAVLGRFLGGEHVGEMGKGILEVIPEGVGDGLVESVDATRVAAGEVGGEVIPKVIPRGLPEESILSDGGVTDTIAPVGFALLSDNLGKMRPQGLYPSPAAALSNPTTSPPSQAIRPTVVRSDDPLNFVYIKPDPKIVKEAFSNIWGILGSRRRENLERSSNEG